MHIPNVRIISYNLIDIQEYIKKKHKIKRQQIEIKLTDPPDPASATEAATSSTKSDPAALNYYPDLIEVTCDHGIDIELLRMYFKSKRSGERKKKGIEYVKNIDKESVIHVKFESAEGKTLKLCLLLILCI